MISRYLRTFAATLVAIAVLAAVAHAQAPTFITSWPTSDLPLGILDDGIGNLYVPDQYGGPGFAKYTTSGAFEGFLAGTAGSEGYGVGKLSNGHIVSADYYGDVVREYTPSGTLVNTWPTGGTRSGYLSVAPNDDIYITDDQQFVVRRFSSTGTLITSWSTPPSPTGVVYSQGVVYVVCYYDNLVSEYTPTGTPIGSFTSGVQRPEQLVSDALGQIYVAAFSDEQLKCYSATGTLLWTLGPTIPGYAYGPGRFAGIEVAADGTVYASDYDHKRVLVFSNTPTPTLHTSFGAVKTRYR